MAGLMTGLAIAGAATKLVGAGMSFADARKQNKIKADAERRAEQAMAAARKSLEVNYMNSLAIQKEPYELERDAALVAGAQATEALRESDRGMGRVGAIYDSQQKAQRKIASGMGQEMFNLDYLSTQEDTRLRDLNTQLDLGEATGAQLEAANAEERRAQQLQAGVTAAGGAAMDIVGMNSLYKNQKAPTAPNASEIEQIRAEQLEGNFSGNGMYSQPALPPTVPDMSFGADKLVGNTPLSNDFAGKNMFPVFNYGFDAIMNPNQMYAPLINR